MRQVIHVASLLRILDEAERNLGEQDVVVKDDLQQLREEVARYASEQHPTYNLLVTSEF